MNIQIYKLNGYCMPITEPIYPNLDNYSQYIVKKYMDVMHEN